MIQKFLSIIAFLTTFIIARSASANIMVPGGCRQGTCFDSRISQIELLREVPKGSLYSINLETRFWSDGTEPPNRFENPRMVYVYCSVDRPAVIFSDDRRYSADLINPGGDWYGYNSGTHKIYWIVCHDIRDDFFSEETTARAIQLGYPLDLTSAQVELSNLLDIVDLEPCDSGLNISLSSERRNRCPLVTEDFSLQGTFSSGSISVFLARLDDNSYFLRFSDSHQNIIIESINFDIRGTNIEPKYIFNRDQALLEVDFSYSDPDTILFRIIRNGEIILNELLSRIFEDDPSQRNGSITGTVIFPSDLIPAQRVCAENVVTEELNCTETRESQSTFTLSTLPGTYFVFSQACNEVYGENQLCMDGYNERRAYYNKYVVCGIVHECRQLNNIPIPVQVLSGKAIRNIRPHDWYN